MVRQKRAKLDRNGLAGLGLDKLIEILLEEASANKALKARLQTALAGGSGAEEAARLIDKRLDQIARAETRISSARAKDLTAEFSGLARNILSELGAADPPGAAERMLRFLALRYPVSARLVSDSARLWKVFDEAEISTLALIGDLAPEQQVALTPAIEALRRGDRYGEYTAFPRQLVEGLAAPALAAWKALLRQVATGEPIRLGAFDLLQAIARREGDVDAFIAIEREKPENRRDMLVVARLLMEAGRYAEALEWIRIRPAGMRLLSVNGITASVGVDYEAAERRLLEAAILERLGRRSDAQALRWREFSETLEPAVLRLYLSKLDDFEEFDEFDKALALVTGHKDIYAALEFLVAWPRLAEAASHVLRHAGRWDGAQSPVLIPAAEALADHDPLAATVLYRALIGHILSRGVSEAYDRAATYLSELTRLAPRLPQDAPLPLHAAYLAELRRVHLRKHGFWSAAQALLP